MSSFLYPLPEKEKILFETGNTHSGNDCAFIFTASRGNWSCWGIVSNKLSFQEKKCEWIAAKKKMYKTISLLRIEQKNPNRPTKTQSKTNQKTTQKINQPTNQPASKSIKKSHKKGHCKEISPQGILASCNYN